MQQTIIRLCVQESKPTLKDCKVHLYIQILELDNCIYTLNYEKIVNYGIKQTKHLLPVNHVKQF